MKKLINFRPIPIFFLSIMVGILLVSLSSLVYGLVAIGVGIVALLVVISSKKLRVHYSKVIIILLALIIGVTSCGVTLSVISSDKEYVPSVNITGRVRADTKFTADGVIDSNYIVIDNVTYEGNSGTGDIEGNVTVRINHLIDHSDTEVGDYITVFGSLVPTQLILTDSYSVAEYTSGIRYSVQAETFDKTRENDINFFDNIKVRAKTVMLSHMSIESAELTYSMVFGDSSSMNRLELDAYREIGIAHLFAVSGLHIAVLAGAVSAIISKCKGNKYIDYFLTLGVVLFYAALTGFGVSVMRALIMLIVYKTGNMLSYRHCAITSVCLAGCIILAVDPIMLFSLSFQLSMLAIIGIHFFLTPISNKLKFLPKSIASLVALTISVNIAIVPVMLSVFGDVSLIFLLANLLLIPIITILFPFVLLILGMATLIPIFGWILVPFNYIFELFAIVSLAIAGLDFLSISVSPSMPALILYMLFMLLVSKYVMIEGRTRAIISGAGVIVFAGCVMMSSYHLIDFSTRVNVISSSSTHEYVVINDFGGETYLIINGDYDSYDIIDIVEYMSQYNITHIDGLIKPTFTDEEIMDLFDTFEFFNPTFVVTNAYHAKLDYMFEDRQYPFYENDEILITIESNYWAEQVLVSVGEVNVGFSNVNPFEGEICFIPDDNIDILFANGDRQYIDNLLPDYYVSDYPYGVIANTIESKFTIKIKNDKINIR